MKCEYAGRINWHLSHNLHKIDCNQLAYYTPPPFPVLTARVFLSCPYIDSSRPNFLHHPCVYLYVCVRPLCYRIVIFNLISSVTNTVWQRSVTKTLSAICIRLSSLLQLVPACTKNFFFFFYLRVVYRITCASCILRAFFMRWVQKEESEGWFLFC